MPRSRRLQDLQWRLEALGYDLVAGLMRVAPIDTASNLGGALLKLVGPLTSTHRTVRRNLRLAFPDWSEAERERVGRLAWENVGRVFTEFLMMDRIMKDPSRVEMPDAQRLAQVFGVDRPLLFVSGHFANFEVMAAASRFANVSGMVAYRGLNNPYIDARMKEMRRRYGIELFAPKTAQGGREMMAALKNHVPLGILLDQKYNQGLLTPFFGHGVHTQHAPVRFAMRFGAVMQLGWVERTKGARFRLYADEAVVLDPGGGADAIAETVAKVNAFIERRARARPWEYWWVHRRFPDAVYAELAAQGF
jgi:Kdo2-lipid IVA lauroyltransferase/acyltransferase